MSSSSWYRRSVLHFKGGREYTKSGFEAASVNFIEKDLDVDCSGKQYMITGANSALGLATALEIAKRGGELHLVCRNAKSMKEARSHIITSTGNDRIYQHQVNLSKPREVIRWAEEFLRNNKRLDVLINNASCINQERIVDDDGIESTFAVNTLAVHIIVTTLLPLIEMSSKGDGRVILVSSAGMYEVKLDPVDLNFEKMKPYDGIVAYRQTKRQQVAMNFSYAQKYPKVHFSCMHPGWVDTPGLQISMPEFYKETKETLRTPLQGADTIVWLAVSEASRKLSSGLFYQDRTQAVTHLPMAWTKATLAMEKDLMQKLEDLLIKFSTIDDYFTISDIGSDILNSGSFIGLNDDKDVAQNLNNVMTNSSSVQLDQEPTSSAIAVNNKKVKTSSDVVTMQSSLDHPARTPSISLGTSNSDDDEIINAVENILYNNDNKMSSSRLKESSSGGKTIKKTQNENDSNLPSESGNNSISSMKTETYINGSTSDRRKEEAIDDLLNDAFETVSLKEQE